MSRANSRRRAFSARQRAERRGEYEAERVPTTPLEACICGQHVDCPDGWHYGDDLPCGCTPDCALLDEAGPMSATRSGSGLRNVLVSVRFSQRQAELIGQLGEEQEITVSSLVRRAVSQYAFSDLGPVTAERTGRAAYRRRRAS